MAFTVIVVGDPVLASVAMGNWRNVNYGNALLPVDATGNGVNNTIAAGSSSYRFSNTYSVLGNFSGQITSTLITGTAPFSIASTTKVANLNADFLDDQTGSYYQNSDNQSAGTLPSGRLAGSYTGITGLGTIASATTISVSSGSPLTLIGPSGGDNLLNLGNSVHTGFSSILGYANTSLNDNTMLRIAAYQNSSGSAVQSAYVVLAKEGYVVDDKSQIFFGTHDGTSVAKRMTIKSSGNVGIGISDPIQKLHIYGTTSNPGILIGDASSRIGIYYDSSVGDSVIYGYNNPGGGDATCIRFKTPSSSGSDKLTLTRDGKILLGAASAQGLINVPDHTTAAGGLYIGSDVTLYRSAANILKTDDSLNVVGDIYTTAWTDYSGSTTLAGFSSTITLVVTYKKIGKFVFVHFIISGTSNATTFTFTVPNASANASIPFHGVGTNVINNTVASATPASIVMSANTNIIQILRDGILGTTWTSSGLKQAAGQFFYEAAA